LNGTRAAALSLLCFVLLFQPLARAQDASVPDATPRLIGEVFANGRHLSYVSTLSDEIGRLAALPTLSLAREDVLLLRRLLSQNRTARLRLDVSNRVGGAFEATNVVGEIKGSETPNELVVVGAHLDSNDLGPGALDNAAGCAAVLETARAIKAGSFFVFSCRRIV
jgi:hypothetical protein